MLRGPFGNRVALVRLRRPARRVDILQPQGAVGQAHAVHRRPRQPHRLCGQHHVARRGQALCRGDLRDGTAPRLHVGVCYEKLPARSFLAARQRRLCQPPHVVGTQHARPQRHFQREEV